MPSPLLKPHERPPVPLCDRRDARFRILEISILLGRLVVGNLILLLKGKKTRPQRHNRFVRTLSRLGLVWIRVAQTLALQRTDLSSEASEEILELSGIGQAYPFEDVKPLLLKTLNKDLDEVFDTFNEQPFAATAVSQTHRARLKANQTWVAVKVQHPNAREIFARDLDLFVKLFKVFRFFGVMKAMRWADLLHEFKQIQTQELNYHYEASAIKELGKNLRGSHVQVPKVWSTYCGEQVLVMSFIQGALLSDIIALQKLDPKRVQNWLDTNNIHLPTVAQRLFHSVYSQVFEHNYFHGHLSTENIILLRDSRMAFIGCRGSGSLETESLSKQEVFLRELARGEWVNAAEIYFLLASRLPQVDLSKVKDKLIRIWRLWSAAAHVTRLPYRQRSHGYLMGEMNKLLQKHRFAPQWSLSILTKTWLHLDACLVHLDPNFNYLKHLLQYFKNTDNRRTRKAIVEMPQRLAQSALALNELPDRIEEYKLFQENLMRRQAQVVRGSSSKVEAVLGAGFSILALLTAMSTVFIGLTFLYGEKGLPSWLGPQLNELATKIPNLSEPLQWAVMACLILLFAFLRRERNRFSKGDSLTSAPSNLVGP